MRGLILIRLIVKLRYVLNGISIIIIIYSFFLPACPKCWLWLGFYQNNRVFHEQNIQDKAKISRLCGNCACTLILKMSIVSYIKITMYQCFSWYPRWIRCNVHYTECIGMFEFRCSDSLCVCGCVCACACQREIINVF